jgi:hypothetical protein
MSSRNVRSSAEITEGDGAASEGRPTHTKGNAADSTAKIQQIVRIIAAEPPPQPDYEPED